MKFLYALLYIAALGILSHFVGQALPRAWFSAERFPYRAAEWENGGKVYEKLGIKRWKDFLPDMSRIMPDMVKKESDKAEPRSRAWACSLPRPALRNASTFG